LIHGEAKRAILEDKSGGCLQIAMKVKVVFPLSRQIASDGSILVLSVLSGLAVFLLAIVLQWLIYDDWLHRNGPVRLVGSALSFAITFLFVYRWQQAKRAEKIEVLKRIETIKWMNDRIRNSLQAIECLVFATNAHVTDPVRDAVDAIEEVLQEMLSETPISTSDQLRVEPQSNAARTSVRGAPWT
jgi:hypothetical protein